MACAHVILCPCRSLNIVGFPFNKLNKNNFRVWGFRCRITIKGSLGASLLNQSRWMKDGDGHGSVDGTCLRRGKIKVLPVDSLSNDDEA